MRGTLGSDIIPLHHDQLLDVARSLVFPDATPVPAPKPERRLGSSVGGDSAPVSITAETTGDEAPAQAIQVILRIRPLSEKERAETKHSCLSVPKNKPSTIHILPQDPSKHPASIRNAGKAIFKFSKIFDDTTSQSDIFEHTALPLVEGLFHAKSAVVFAYGVTCSGKTWTIQGAAECPGLIPRSLDVIINSIAVAKGKGLLQDTVVSDDVLELTSCSFRQSNAGVVTRRRRNLEGKQPEKVHDSNYLEIDGSVEYSLFASYLEIYNEQCYDLFERPGTLVKEEPASVAQNGAGVPSSKDAEEISHEAQEISQQISAAHKKRRVLKLKEDSSGEIYAEGLTEVEIHSGADVDRLLEFGQENRSVARTNANEHSSRSHAVFTITLRQSQVVEQERGPPKTLKKSSKLFIVDLAGSERTSRTNNSGTRLKEAAKINTSLMTLGRCLEVMRQNQKAAAKDPTKKLKIVPFRQSRLTRLLQHSLGAGSAVMIANVSQTTKDADETIRVLRCAAIAGEVIIQRRKPAAAVLTECTNTVQNNTRSQAVRRLGTKAAKESNRLPPRRTRAQLQDGKEFNTRTRAGKSPDQDGKVESDESWNNCTGKEKQLTELKRQLQKALKTADEHKKELEETRSELVGVKRELSEQKKENAEQLKDIAQLRWQIDEEILERKAVDDENDKLWRGKERYEERIADMESRIHTLHAEVREETVREADAIIAEMQEQHELQLQQVIADSQAFVDRKMKAKVPETEVRDKVRSRLSLAVDQTVAIHFPGDGESSEEEMGEEDEEEYIEEDCDYIE